MSEERKNRNYYVVRTSNNVDKYVEQGVTAVGWSRVNFSEYKTPEDLFDAVKCEYYPKEYQNRRVAGRKLGEVRRLRNIKCGDVVLVPCYKGFYIGIATGSFRYVSEECDNDLANQVELNYIKRDGNVAFYARAGKNTALASKLAVPGFTALPITDEIIIQEIDGLIAKNGQDASYQDKAVSEEKQRVNEFKKVIKSVLQDYSQTGLNAKGIGFENLLKSMLEYAGFTAEILPKRIGGSGKADADILAVHNSELGVEFSTAFYIQAKHYSGESNAGIDQLVEFKKKLLDDGITIGGRTFGEDQLRYVLISSGDFSESCREQAAENEIILINGDQLSEMLFDVIDDIPEVRYQLGFVKSFTHI